MKKYEYKTMSFNSKGDDEYLKRNFGPIINDMGSTGWKLVSVAREGSNYTCFFERELN